MEKGEMPVRLNKYLSDAGVCSRREADRLMEQGRITVDGERAAPGTRVFPSQRIMVDGREALREEEKVILAVNKPAGVVCTTTDRFKEENIVDFVHYPKRIYPVGRLDKNSEGLILMTNRGDIVNAILKAGNYHEKEYVVTVNKPLTPEFLERMQSGVPILDTVTRPCRVVREGKKTFRIVLTQGLNRQIRRMCEYLGYRVEKLTRVRIMNICLGELPLGSYRELTEEELRVLMLLIKKEPFGVRQDGKRNDRKETDRKEADRKRKNRRAPRPDRIS